MNSFFFHKVYVRAVIFCDHIKMDRIHRNCCLQGKIKIWTKNHRNSLLLKKNSLHEKQKSWNLLYPSDFVTINHIAQASLRSPRPKGGGGHIVPPPEFLYFLADCYEIWYRCKTSHDLKADTVKVSQGHHVGAHFHKNVTKKWGNMIWHTLKESVRGSNSNITSVNDPNKWYFISLIIKEDIPYHKLTYSLQLMVQI